MTTTLRHGDRSQAVLMLQKNLNKHGANLYPDGVFGDDTESAVRAYQLNVGLVVDGAVRVALDAPEPIHLWEPAN